MSRNTVYSADEVTVNFSGINIESGRGEDEFVEIEQEQDTFTYKAGVDGEGTRSENKNTVTKITLTLSYTSASNDLLSAIHELDKKVAGGSGIAPIMIRDRLGTQLFASAEAWIIKPPMTKLARHSGERKWVFHAHQPQRFDGGH